MRRDNISLLFTFLSMSSQATTVFAKYFDGFPRDQLQPTPHGTAVAFIGGQSHQKLTLRSSLTLYLDQEGRILLAATLNLNNIFDIRANDIKLQNILGNLSGKNFMWSVSVY